MANDAIIPRERTAVSSGMGDDFRQQLSEAQRKRCNLPSGGVSTLGAFVNTPPTISAARAPTSATRHQAVAGVFGTR